jgi:hypothetical protein
MAWYIDATREREPGEYPLRWLDVPLQEIPDDIS